MPAGQVQEVLALSIVFVVHIVGAIALFWGILGDEERKPWRRRFGRGDGGDGPPNTPDPSPRDDPAPLPFGDASPSRVRLRDEDGRLADGYPRPPRRPEHPAPVPAPMPSRD